MIGVIARAGQRDAVEEFFELFKTPWEYHRPGRTYDVVIATADAIPDVDAQLLIVYGPDQKSRDATDGVIPRSLQRGARVRYLGGELPVYGHVLTFDADNGGVPCLTAGRDVAALTLRKPDVLVIRVGYDLFQEIEFLLSSGQPPAHAHVPTLDIHVAMLREWILEAGIPVLEIAAAPAGYSFTVCLTHDIDFVGIRRHRFDHTMWGFLYRSTIGALRNVVRRRLTIAHLLRSWRAAASLPFVYAGWIKDFWEPFDWYLRLEDQLPVTYFLIPFKGRPGDNVSAQHGRRRATAYDIDDVAPSAVRLTTHGCEIGVHGLDAWHSVEKGRDELQRIANVTGSPSTGIRMHWLLRDDSTFRVLENAGYEYDSTVGYNETVGYRSGTTQVFRPAGARTLLEIPLHIQDGALFYPQRLDLSESDAWRRCDDMIQHARTAGGVLTVLWHDRSHAPERFWGRFYTSLVRALRSLDAWFATAGEAVRWFRNRRQVRFERVDHGDGPVRTLAHRPNGTIAPPLKISVHRPHSAPNGPGVVDVPWTGETVVDVDALISRLSGFDPRSMYPLR
jgi:peptidoglycan/xylan/chitin deacetylase (PgdA/CDA1 family)